MMDLGPSEPLPWSWLLVSKIFDFPIMTSNSSSDCKGKTVRDGVRTTKPELQSSLRVSKT